MITLGLYHVEDRKKNNIWTSTFFWFLFWSASEPSQSHKINKRKLTKASASLNQDTIII